MTAACAWPGRWPLGELRALLRQETERVGLWLDTTAQSAEQTAGIILANLDASRVCLPLRADQSRGGS
jgi:hypothetical protein